MRKCFPCLALIASALFAGSATAGTIGIGAFGGVNIPIVQDDNGQGMVFGVRAPVRLVPLLTLEPYFASSQGGDKDQEVGGVTYTRTGLDGAAFGLNAMLTFGGKVQFYPFAGIGTNTLTRDGSEDLSLTGFNFGLGLGISPMDKVRLHVRGEGSTLTKDEKGRIFAGVTVGVDYELFPFGQ